MARFEAQTALGEFVHVLQQLHRALEHAGKIEQRVRFERVLVLLERDRENPPHATRHDGVEIAAERADRLVHRGRNLRRRGAVPFPRIGRITILGIEAGAHELVAARLAVLREEIGAQTIDQLSKRRLGLAIRRAALRSLSRVASVGAALQGCVSCQRAEVLRQHRELRVVPRAVGEKRVQAVARRR